jgi:hypothetical protein
MEQPVTFEQAMEMMSQMSEQERKAAVEELTDLCICSTCPTYVGTGETELLFCIVGTSDVISEDKGCPCPACPVTPRIGLRWNDYCLKGSGQQRLAQGE